MTRPAAQRTRRTPAERPAAAPRPAPPAAHPRVFRRRRRLAILLGAVVLLGGLGFGVRFLLFDAGLVDVEDVQVVGADGVATCWPPRPRDGAGRDVLAAAAVPERTPLVAVDTGAVAERVGALPAVASVDVSRTWPHTVTVVVAERVPVATLDTPDGPALVDASGAARTARPSARPARTGGARHLPATRPRLAAVAGARRGCPAAVRPEVESVRATVAVPGAPAQVTIGLRGGREVRWGTPERAAEKGAVLVALLTQPGHVYDVTSPDLPTIRR
ncbi:hypothetical protein BJF78_07910 [Pseudonocardia sp. CNS-139]|nr:hypothetical protein BJF78_07910 [Pseudonocardia sp. CNS-139]